VVRIHQQDHVGFPNLAREVVPFLGNSRGIDNGRCSDIFGSSDGRRNGYLWKNWLDLICDKDTFDERGDETGLASALVTADADPNWLCGQSRFEELVEWRRRTGCHFRS
jgi:hypothetical protein